MKQESYDFSHESIQFTQLEKYIRKMSDYNVSYPNINYCYNDKVTKEIADFFDLPELLKHYWSPNDQDSFIKKIKEYNFEKQTTKI